MSLKIKTLGMLLAVLLLFIAAQGLIHRFVILPGFLELEQTQTDKNIQRTIQAIDRELFHLSSLVHDWSAWDDTYDFITSRSEDFIRSNLHPDATFDVNHIQLMLICDQDGGAIWSKAVDPLTGGILPWTDVIAPTMLKPLAVFSAGSGGTALSDLEQTGLVHTALGPLMLSIRPVLTSDSLGPIRGALAMGRLLTPKDLQGIIKQTGVDFTLMHGETLSDEKNGAVFQSLIGKKDRVIVDRSDDQTLVAYTLLDDMMGHPVYVVKTTMFRTILKKGLETLHFSMLFIVAAGAVLILLSLVFLHLAVLGPLYALSRHVRVVEESGDLGSRLDLNRDDEIGDLARQFDAMMETLAQMRSELLDRSYFSGLASMTSDVLHQGRNIMMPMAQYLEGMLQLCRSLPRENVHKAITELEQGTTDPEREKNLNRFVSLSAGEMLRTLEKAEHLLAKASGQNKNMENLFQDLEKFSRSGTVASDVDPVMLVRHALLHLPDDVMQNCRIRTGPGLETLGRFQVEHLVLTQVFASILFHAASLVVKAPGDILIDARSERENDTDVIRFVISVNEPEPDAVQRTIIFSRDYRVDDRCPFCSNLHWCSNVISAMGGVIALTGSRHGAEFHLVLPFGGGV